MIAGISQGGLGLPERDYYFREDQRTKDIRAEYEKHVARTLELLGETAAAAESDAKTVMKVETELAGASMPNVELRDPQKIYHRVDRERTEAACPRRRRGTAILRRPAFQASPPSTSPSRTSSRRSMP